MCAANQIAWRARIYTHLRLRSIAARRTHKKIPYASRLLVYTSSRSTAVASAQVASRSLSFSRRVRVYTHIAIIKTKKKSVYYESRDYVSAKRLTWVRLRGHALCHRFRVADKSLGDTASDVISDSSGVGTSQSDTTNNSLTIPGTTVVCVEPYNTGIPGHLAINQGDILEGQCWQLSSWCCLDVYATGRRDDCVIAEFRARNPAHGKIMISYQLTLDVIFIMSNVFEASFHWVRHICAREYVRNWNFARCDDFFFLAYFK